MGIREIAEQRFPEALFEKRAPCGQNRKRELKVCRQEKDGHGRERPIERPAGQKQPAAKKQRERRKFRKLRRRLSTIFHREMFESGLRARCPDYSGTRGSSQKMICQSPRTQRCLRRLKALKCEG